MRRNLALGAAGVLFLLVVVGITSLVRNAVDDGERVRAPQSGRSPTDERAPEAETPADLELPRIDRAARGFLRGYLPLIYGKDGASVAALRYAAPPLITKLQRDPGRVPPAQAALTPRVVRVAVIRDGPGLAQASVEINDRSAVPYVLNFRLEKTLDEWVVTRIGA